MKIGEALLEKTKLKRKLADLQGRLTQCLFRTKLEDKVIQEPEDSYTELEDEFTRAVNAYHALNNRIQKTNANTETLAVMSAIAAQSAIAQALEGVLTNCAAASGYGGSRTWRTKEDSYVECVVATKELRERIETLKNGVLDLNSKLNGLNWSTELL